MPKEKIIIVGSGGHAKVVIDSLQDNLEYDIVGIIDSFATYDYFLGYKILGGTEDLKEIISQYNIHSGFVAIGDNWIRRKEVEAIKKENKDFNFISILHHRSIVSSNVIIGKGVFVGPGAIINSGSSILDHVVINTKASLDHDLYVGEYASIGPGVTTGGGVQIGSYTHIGLGANILEKIKIGSHVLVGAGSLVNKNIDDKSIVYGLPGKFIRNRSEGESIYR